MKKTFLFIALVINIFLYSLNYREIASGGPIADFSQNSFDNSNGRTLLQEPIYEEIFFQKLKVNFPIYLHVFNRKGDIKIEGWNKDYLEITAVKQCSNSLKQLKNTFITVNEENGLTVRSIAYGKNECARVSYTIKVPKNVYIGQIETEEGEVKIQNIENLKYSKN